MKLCSRAFPRALLAMVKRSPFQNARGGVATASYAKPGLKPVSLDK